MLAVRRRRLVLVEAAARRSAVKCAAAPARRARQRRRQVGVAARAVALDGGRRRRGGGAAERGGGACRRSSARCASASRTRAHATRRPYAASFGARARRRRTRRGIAAGAAPPRASGTSRRRVARRRRAEVARRAQQHVAAVGEIAQRAAGSRIVAQHLERAAGVEVALGKLGPQRERRVVRDDRLAVAVLVLESDAEVVVRLGRRRHGDRRSEARRRLDRAAGVEQRDRGVVSERRIACDPTRRTRFRLPLSRALREAAGGGGELDLGLFAELQLFAFLHAIDSQPCANVEHPKTYITQREWCVSRRWHDCGHGMARARGTCAARCESGRGYTARAARGLDSTRKTEHGMTARRRARAARARRPRRAEALTRRRSACTGGRARRSAPRRRPSRRTSRPASSRGRRASRGSG